jgi:1-acyl-sn-glycerol-3-phosphate acyltransferase
MDRRAQRVELALMRRLNHAWRLSVTGACFVLFAVGGALCSLAIFPALRFLPGGVAHRPARVKRMVRGFFAFLVAILRATGVMRLEITGIERLRDARAVLVLANHPSYIDVVVLLSLIPRASCVVKAGLWRSPFFGGVVSAAGYIRNSTPEQLVADCQAALDAGDAVVIFPEGTRSRPNEPLKFLRGAAHVALQSGREIVPVLLQCDPPTLSKGSRWYDVPERPFSFRVAVRAELHAGRMANLHEPRVLAARRLTHALEGYFSEELKAL